MIEKNIKIHKAKKLSVDKLWKHPWKTLVHWNMCLDKYSKIWSWKVTGDRAVSMISRLVPEAWYGENINEVIIPDSTESVKQTQTHYG